MSEGDEKIIDKIAFRDIIKRDDVDEFAKIFSSAHNIVQIIYMVEKQLSTKCMKFMLCNNMITKQLLDDMLCQAVVHTDESSQELDFIKLLLTFGANPNIDLIQSKSPMIVSPVFRRCPKLVKLLIQYGANVDNVVTANGMGIIQLACFQSAECLKVLAEAGANLKVKMYDGVLPDATHYLQVTIPHRIRACRDAVMTLILCRRNGNVPFIWVDKHNVLQICRLLWATRRSPAWDGQ